MAKSMTLNPLTVADLIKHLQTFPQDLPVCYRKFSEQCLLEIDDIKVDSLCMSRPDGWIEDKRPDKLSMDYLVFPGN